MTEPSYSPEWDQLSIETPEMVALDMPVAGIGSRFVALLVDYLIWFVGILILVFLIQLIDPSLTRFAAAAAKWEQAAQFLFFFLLYWGYFTLFEAFWDGRTPGKRIAKIRVIQRSGRGIGLFESMTRNLLRVVDQIPVVYMVGVVSILVTRQHQRLGDLAAGTLVVHERENLTEISSISSGRTFTSGIFEPQQGPAIRPATVQIAASGIQLLGQKDLEVLEGFFARRLDFSLETRALLAQRIADGIRAKTGLPVPAGVSNETFLEEVARQVRDLARLG